MASPRVRQAGRGFYVLGGRRGRSHFALRGIREAVTVAAQEIVASPKKFCNPPITAVVERVSWHR
jgi:hypothetical protein